MVASSSKETTVDKVPIDVDDKVMEVQDALDGEATDSTLETGFQSVVRSNRRRRRKIKNTRA